MRSTTITVLLLSLLGMTNALGQPAAKANEKTISYLKKFRSDYIKSIQDKKPELLEVYYADTVRLMPSFQKTIVGKGNATLYYKAFSNRFTIRDFSSNEIETLDLGSQVLEIGTFTMQLSLKSSGKEHTLAGKYLNLWKELKNGELALITQAWNYDQYYGEIHDQLKFDEVPAFHTALKPNVIVNNNISFELSALNRLLDVAVTQHDAAIWSLYYADDSMLLTSYHPMFKGKKAIDEYFAMHVKELPVFEALDIRNDRIDNLGVFVIEYASHIASWRNGNSSGVGTGKNIRIWRRGEDHALKLFRAMGMYD